MQPGIAFPRTYSHTRLKSAKSLSVVVPVYNSQLTLMELADRLHGVLTALSRESEMVFVNDGSSDESWDCILKILRKYDNVVGLDLTRNYGQHNALLAGIRHARCALIVTLDDDLQNPPEEIPLLLEELERRDLDVVYGVPSTVGHDRWRNAASFVTKWALRTFMGAETAQRVTSFRVFRATVGDAFRNYAGAFVSIDVLLTWGTTRFGSVSVQHAPRLRGKSNYSFRMLLTHALNMVTGFSTLPLQIASYIGFAFTLFGLGVLAFVVGKYLMTGTSVPGFPFLASIVAIFSGAQLFALGIIGEYLARMYFRILDRPSFSLRTEARSTANPGVVDEH
jgi:undecaprenyl-phosphate 4-deoxy-4-formamido-L-arabinose transferase